MAESEKKQKKSLKDITKLKKKKWFPIVTPIMMGERPIGESYLEDSGSAVGRTVKVNLIQLTGDIKSQSCEIKFEISDSKDNRLTTKIIGYSFSPATIKRFMRRHMTRIDDSVVVLTKDNVLLRMKPFLLTRSKVSRSVEYTLRMAMREEIINTIRKNDAETIFSMVLKYQLQKELREKLSRIYPVKNLEMRVLKVEKHHSAKVTELPAKKVHIKSKSKREMDEEKEEEHKKAEHKEAPVKEAENEKAE